MNLTTYDFFINDENSFWFKSDGKAGSIIKAVLFQELPEENRFNLAMGDFEGGSGINFSNLSNNRDTRKVFSTVGSIVLEYLTVFPTREIFIAGNTQKKRDLYSFMVSAYIEEISQTFDIFGADEGELFEEFVKDKIYDNILVRRK